MPRRRANTQEPPRKRSRKGCDKCRFRKVRCDEAKPVCEQCRVKGFECTTSVVLKWETDYVGRAFGRTGVWRKKAARTDPSSPCSTVTGDEVSWCEIPYISSYSFVNATVGNVDQFATLEHHDMGRHVTARDLISNRAATPECDDIASTASLSPWLSRASHAGVYMHIPPTLTPLPRLSDPMHARLLSYYLERLCPMTVASYVSKSPFASLVLPFSLSSSPTTLESILALAACHRSKSDTSFKPIALKLADKVLRSLRGRLCHEDPREVAMDPETLVVMMILCQFEIINECDKRWVVHLRGARDLIRVRRRVLASSSSNPPSNELVAFTEKYFAFQDVIGRTACGEEPNFGSDFWQDNEGETDPWLGCSPSLVATICDITELSRQHSKDPSVSSLPDFQQRAYRLEKHLTSLQQRVFGEQDDLLQTSAELKRIAAEVYLQCSVYGASPSVPSIRQDVLSILRLVCVLLEHKITAGMAWPLFVASVELDPVEELEWSTPEECTENMPHQARPFVLYALHMISHSIANISRTRTVIEQVWHARDFPEFSPSEIESGHNDWERFVAPFCGNMSLA